MPARKYQIDAVDVTTRQPASVLSGFVRLKPTGSSRRGWAPITPEMAAAAITMDEFLASAPEPAWTPEPGERFSEEEAAAVLFRRLLKLTQQGLDSSHAPIFVSRLDITLH
jgi:hypothetical protein